MNSEILDTLRLLSKPCKYTTWYISLVEHSLIRVYPEDTYCESHHIIPKSLKHLVSETILNSPNNIVKLSAREHFILHLLLVKMFTCPISKQKMNFAFFQMKSKNKFQTERYINSRFYEMIKREKVCYKRLYSGEQVIYIHPNDECKLLEMVNEGWSPIMTDEYKNGRVGNMKGKKHSDETKAKMSRSSKSIPKLWLSGREVSEETKNKAKITRQLRMVESPDFYKNSREKVSNKMKLKYRNGELSVKGDKNPRYGVILSNEQKQKQSESMQRRSNNGMSHLEICETIIIPALSKRPMYISEIQELVNCKWRPNYIRRLIREVDGDFDIGRVLRTPIVKTDDHNKKHAESLQRMHNNGFTYEEIYSKYIATDISHGLSPKQIQDKNNLSQRTLKNIIERFHPKGKEFWRCFITKA